MRCLYKSQGADMMLDTTKAMTVYEFAALVLSIIAILVQVIQWVYNKWFLKGRLKVFSFGPLHVFNNLSGSYVQMGMSFEAVAMPIVIREIKISITRLSDNKELEETWSSFISPVVQRAQNSIVQANETAHPIMILNNQLISVQIEFAGVVNKNVGDLNEIVGKFLRKNIEGLKIDATQSYDSCLERISQKEEFKKCKKILDSNYFWTAGKYEIDLRVDHDNNRLKQCKYLFEISKSDEEKLRENSSLLLLNGLKEKYGLVSIVNTLHLGYCFRV